MRENEERTKEISLICPLINLLAILIITNVKMDNGNCDFFNQEEYASKREEEYTQLVRILIIRRKNWDRRNRYYTDLCLSGRLSMCYYAQFISRYLWDTMMKFGTLTCFGPQTKLIEIGSDRTILLITPRHINVPRET